MRTLLSRLLIVTAVALALAVPAAAQEHVDIAGLVADATARATAHVQHDIDAIVADAMAHARHAADQGQRHASDRVEQIDRVTKAIKIGAAGQLDLSNISGTITITAAAGDELRIEAVKRGRGATDADAKAQLDLVTVEIAERAGRVEVRTRYKEGERHISASVDYTVTAPAGTRATVRSVSGDIKVTGLKGDLDVESVSGDVVVDSAGQLDRAKSVSGDITVTGAQAEGTVEVGSVSGDVRVRTVKARRVESESVSGDIELTDATCDAVAAKTVSGDVTFAGPLSKGGRYEFKAHSGDVQLALAGAGGFELDATTFSGSIKSDLPITLFGGKDEPVSRRSIHGTWGDGGAVVNVTTFSGSVTIRKR